MIGAWIFGTYWVLTSTLGSMHEGESFSALKIMDYNHFLRMRFEKDKLTIYPIALDKVPRRKGWRVPKKSDPPRSHNPKIVPKRKMKPHLIEEPIVIHAANLK